MSTAPFNKLLLKTVFCCMASDGHIDKREISLLQTLYQNSDLFKEFDFQESINQLISEINKNGRQFIEDYFDLLHKSHLSETEELSLIEFAIKTIYADEQVEYSEIKFFKNIRHRLKVSDEKISARVEIYQDIKKYLGEDIMTESILDKVTNQYLDMVEFPQFNFIDIENSSNG